MTLSATYMYILVTEYVKIKVHSVHVCIYTHVQHLRVANVEEFVL